MKNFSASYKRVSRASRCFQGGSWWRSYPQAWREWSDHFWCRIDDPNNGGRGFRVVVGVR
jgi:hypothetical protein